MWPINDVIKTKLINFKNYVKDTYFTVGAPLYFKHFDYFATNISQTSDRSNNLAETINKLVKDMVPQGYVSLIKSVQIVTKFKENQMGKKANYNFDPIPLRKKKP